MVIKIILLIAFFSMMIGVGIYAKNKSKDVNGFVLGSRSVGPWLSAFAFGTSYFSAVIFVGYAGQFGWKFGIASTWIGLGNAFIGSLLAWVILGRRTRLMTQRLNSTTMPQFFEKRYYSKALKYASAIIIFIFLIPYTASLYNGLSRLFSMAFNIDYIYCIILMSVITGIYVIVGGYFATAINDFIQGLIMLFGIIAVIIAVLNQNGGLMSSMIGLSGVTGSEANMDVPGIFNSFLGPDPFALLCVVILTSLGTWGLPQMVQKFYAIKSEKDIYKGTIISTVFAVIVAGGSYFLGGFGRLFMTEETVKANGFDSIVPKMLENLPEILIGIVVVLVLSASMSTLSSLVLTSSSTLTLDLIKEKPSSDKKKDEKQKLLIMRLLIVVFVVISAVIAIVQQNFKSTFIAQMMGISWGALAGAFLAPFLYGLYWKKATKAACAVNFAFGVTFMIINMLNTLHVFGENVQLLPNVLASPINSGAFTMLAGLIIIPVVSLITPKFKGKEKEGIQTLFEKVRRESNEISSHKL